MTDKEIGVIIKPIFAKMVHSKFFAYEYGIECYKKGMEYQGIKELAIENDNLIKQVRTLKAQTEKMKLCANCKHCGVSGWCNKLNIYLLDKANQSCGNWEIKEKYKNGITPEILAEFIKNI